MQSLALISCRLLITKFLLLHSCNEFFEIFFCRILNYIDIDCGPNGNCPEHAAQARKDFKPIFIAAWDRALTKIGSGINQNITLYKTSNQSLYMSKKCPHSLMNQAQCSQ